MSHSTLPRTMPHEPDPAVERQNARLDQRFELLKSDLTQWFGYMSQQQGEKIESAVEALRAEMVTENQKVVGRLDALATLIENALREIPRSE